jgi:hypothetical protein
VLTTSRIVLLPLAAAAVCQTVQATTYLSVEQAQRLLFGDQMLTPAPISLSAEDVASLERQTGTHYYPGAVRAWKADSGVLFIDAVVGKHDLITYALAVNNEGKVRQLEILEYREAYGGEVRSNSFRKQFVGRSHADPVQIGHDIQNISGATLSCQHVTDGVRQLLALYEFAFASK